MKRAILTGFEPFAHYKYNPTQDIAIEFNGKKIGDIEVTGLVLPCTYYGSFDMLSKKIDELCPDIILSTGLASQAQGIQIECFGKNLMGGKYADANGFSPKNTHIVPGGKQKYRTNSDSVLLANSVYESGILVYLSIDADSFICNSLLYQTCRRIFEEQLPIKNSFFHTPWTHDYEGKTVIEPHKVIIKKEGLRKGIEIILTELAK